jgi:CheY-like chemotaxis protein
MDLPVSVLVLDDEPLIRESLGDFLEDYEFDVKTSASAQEALDIIRTSRPDVVLVDINLPQSDGNAFILQANKICATTRFIIHTGSIDYSVPAELQAIGVNHDHVAFKPVTELNKLIDTIQQLAGHPA